MTSESMGEDNQLDFEEHKYNDVASDFCFRNSPLGTTTTDPSLNQEVDLKAIASGYQGFFDRYFHPENMWVVVGDIKSHDLTKHLLEDIIESSGFNSPATSPRMKSLREPPVSTFKPGVSIVDVDTDEYMPPAVDFYLVWESVPWRHEDACVFYVLEWLIGSASDFMEGGPGRGMHSRAPSIIHRLEIGEIDTIFKLFRTTGIFGLHYKVTPEDADRTVTEMLYQIATLTETITEEELTRAKNSQALKVAMNMERQLERSVELSYNVFVSFFDCSSSKKSELTST